MSGPFRRRRRRDIPGAGLRPGARPPARWLALALLLVPMLAGMLWLGACSEPAPAKRSFMESAEGVSAPAEVPVGLNPLGQLDTCRPGDMPEGDANRVLVSRPEDFTEDASTMISTLRQALLRPSAGLPPVEFWLAPVPIHGVAQARALGQHCKAMIVLWEPGQAKTLELTLPVPSDVPLRDLVQERLCEFGDHTEQINSLYLTIAGLLSLRENEYDKAVLYMRSARTIDDYCLHLPGLPTESSSASP